MSNDGPVLYFHMLEQNISFEGCPCNLFKLLCDVRYHEPEIAVFSHGTVGSLAVIAN